MSLRLWIVGLVACSAPPELPMPGDAPTPSAPDGRVDGGLDSTPGTLAIEPPAIHVPAGRDQYFVASDGTATLSVLEPGGGTIDATGKYLAPDVPGTYHVVATIGGASATATVVVEQMYLSLVTGRLGGTGNTDGIGDEARFWTPRAVTDDGAGTIFVAQSGAIRAIDIATRAVTTLAGNTGGLADGVGEAAGFAAPSDLAYDPTTHALYVSDGSLVRAIDVPTRTVTTLVGRFGIGYADGPAATAQLHNIGGLCLSGTTLFVADSGNSIIRSIDLASATHEVATVAGTPDVRGDADSATPSLATFEYPTGLACTPTTIYVADPANTAIRTIDRATGAVGTLVGGPGVAEGDGAFATAGSGRAAYLSVDVANHILYAMTSDSQRLHALDLVGHTLTTITPESAVFDHPAGIRVAGGKLWVADSWHSEVRTLDLGSHVVRSIAGNGTITNGAVDGDLANATFTDPQPIVIDTNGDVLVAGNGTIRTVSLATGEVTWRAGKPGTIGTVDGGPNDARIATTEGLLVDPDGTLWETGSSKAIREIARDGTVTTRFGGFDGPIGMVWVNHQIIVSDLTAGTIRSVDLASGAVTTIAGVAGVHETLDGTGTAAHFMYPAALATDGVGKVWIGDWDAPGSTIRELDLTTMAVTTIVGDAHDSSLLDGIGTAARICGPWALVYDGAHSLYIADGGYGPGGFPVAMIRRVWLPTRAVSSFAGQPYRWGVHLGPLQTATMANPFTLVLTPSGSLLVAGGENAIVSIGPE